MTKPLALQAIELLQNPEKWRAAQTAGIRRVESYYTQDMMFGRYRELYDWAVSEGKNQGKRQP
jgi:polysaccharide biosynthesis protein PelF